MRLVGVSSWVLVPEPPLPLPLNLVPEESRTRYRQYSQIPASEFPRRLARTWATCSPSTPDSDFVGLGRVKNWVKDDTKIFCSGFNFTDDKAEFPGFISNCAKHFLKMEHLINIKSDGFLLLVTHD